MCETGGICEKVRKSFFVKKRPAGRESPSGQNGTRAPACVPSETSIEHLRGRPRCHRRARFSRPRRRSFLSRTETKTIFRDVVRLVSTETETKRSGLPRAARRDGFLLIVAERAYLFRLQLLAEHFEAPLRAAAGSGALPADAARQCFGVLHELLAVHARLLSKLEVHLAPDANEGTLAGVLLDAARSDWGAYPKQAKLWAHAGEVRAAIARGPRASAAAATSPGPSLTLLLHPSATAARSRHHRG